MTRHPTPTPVQPEQIILHRICPWNRSTFRNTSKVYIQVGDRKFTAEGPHVYSIHEVGDDGEPLGWAEAVAELPDETRLNAVFDATRVAHVTRRSAIRVAVAAYLNGADRDAIGQAVRDFGSRGTGRNHPRNVERRR